MSRQQMLSSAISFLRDPSTASSPLAQRVQFLESKGLTPQEIEQCLAAANPPVAGPLGPRPIGYARQQFEYERDWRDWFIMAVIGSGVGWLGIKLAQKFLLPHLEPPTETDLQAAQAALEAKYDEASALLAELKVSTDALATSLDEQKELVDSEIEDVRKALKEVKEGEERRQEWCRKIEGQVDDIAKSLPSLMEKQATTTSSSLVDLQSELKSLKSLLIARRPTPTTGSSSGPTSTTSSSSTTERPSTFTPRVPGIPSWQLKPSTPPAAPPSTSSSSATDVKDASSTATQSEDGSSSAVLVNGHDSLADGDSSKIKEVTS